MRFILAYISTCRRRIPQPWARLAYYGSNRFLPRLKDYVGACGAASSLPPQYSTCGCDRCHKQPADAVLHESNEWAHAVLYQPAAAVLHCSTQIHQTSTPSACPRTPSKLLSLLFRANRVSGFFASLREAYQSMMMRNRPQ